MKLKICMQEESKHSDLVSCVDWASVTELYSVSDDHVILMWDIQSGETKQVVSLPKETFATDISWLPSTLSRGRQQPGLSEVFVLACTDGKFLLISKTGRVEKSVEGHKGAVLGVQWSYDGTALLTYGEEGAVKVWSKTGMLRTVLVQSGSPVYCACWSPDSDQVLYGSGKSLVIKPLQSGIKPNRWTAHDGLILCLDWSSAHGLIVSGGEDRKFKVWDYFGMNMHISYLHDSPITSLSWAPDGELFAVGAFDTLRLCDKKGWSHSLEKPSTGSILALSWTSDGTQLAGACGNSQVIFAQIVDRHLEWGNLEVTVNQDDTIDVRDVTNLSAKEHLELNNRIIRVSLRWEYLIITTATQCYIYKSTNWMTPVIIDLRGGSVSVIRQTRSHFLMADDMAGITIYSYEGRNVSTIKVMGTNYGTLNIQALSLSPDTVAIREKNDEKVVHMFDVVSGKMLGDDQPFTHHNDITTLSLSQAGPASQRLLAFLDKNNDLYISSIQGKHKAFPLGSMVTSMCWNETTDMLATMQDGKFVVWCYPVVIHFDKELLPLTKFVKEGSEFSRGPQLLQFTGHHCSLRRSDGALVATSISPFPSLLHELVASNNWEATLRLCRFVRDPVLWACLSGMAASAQQLRTAEVAYAAINEVDKVQYLAYVNKLASNKRKTAELALLCQQPQQAEGIYLQAGLFYRAIQLNIQLFNWERALELAVRNKTHVDTVLGYREHYLSQIGSKESLNNFLQYSEKLTVDWEKIKAKVQMEEENDS